MHLLILILAILPAFGHHHQLPDFYKDLGCTPVKEDNAEHPTSYDCSSHETRDLTKCYYQGRTASIGENMGNLAPCSKNCLCREKGGAAAITCANVECPENLGVRPKEGCYYAYEHGRCCAVKQICPDKEPTPPVTCKHGDQTYQAGQKFYPDEEPCKVCICAANYQGKAEAPFCEDIKCNTQLRSGSRINEGCSPVFFGADGCCPADWKCPDAADKVNEKQTKIRVRTAQACKLGSLVIEAGKSIQSYTSSSMNIDCTCKLPPFLTCIGKQAN